MIMWVEPDLSYFEWITWSDIGMQKWDVATFEDTDLI